MTGDFKVNISMMISFIYNGFQKLIIQTFQVTYFWQSDNQVLRLLYAIAMKCSFVRGFQKCNTINSSQIFCTTRLKLFFCWQHLHKQKPPPTKRCQISKDNSILSCSNFIWFHLIASTRVWKEYKDACQSCSYN